MSPPAGGPPAAVGLPASFYARPTLEVIEALIGKVLVHHGRDGTAAGVIVEAEAYIGESDPACHAAPGPTPRNAPLYGPPGRAYVYLNYGMHFLVNAVTEPPGSPAAVLIRALAPLDGIDLMRRRRTRADGLVPIPPDEALCRGPGNLTKALAIDLGQNGADLAGGALVVEDRGIRPDALVWSRRIGIRVGMTKRWRCHWRDHPCVSGPEAVRGRRRTAGDGITASGRIDPRGPRSAP